MYIWRWIILDWRETQKASVILWTPADDTWVSEAVAGLSWHFIIDKYNNLGIILTYINYS